jgi:membrane protein DedA with SNARE-associated domain
LAFLVPGETALLGAAIDAGTKHDLNIGAVIIVAAGAAIIGRMIGYVMGRELGYRLVLWQTASGPIRRAWADQQS